MLLGEKKIKARIEQLLLILQLANFMLEKPEW